MKVLVIQHSAADSPATAEDVIHRPHFQVQTIRIDRHEAIPESVDADVLMMFGGPLSLSGSDHPPWVAREQQLVRRYVQEGRRVFGICLGSQMIAAALGAKVQRNPSPEVGWYPIERAAGAKSDLIGQVFPDQLTVLQWHQDTFDIPAGASHLFQSEGCRNQAFTIDDRVFGFQFHMEANPRTVATFLAGSKLWQRESAFVQTEDEINAG
ncbi:MAG: type 1 glutamine amidotransferase, partial [Pirellulales bacterium]|nr:type 1 glutamine amidotransferase [Pirellulales bacterium]